eukprot:TRINITY_DN27012_c0_g1_i1.p1 TRINITY_DN27012_c0_g1~~TRINITY_DN27012_c0_g1_i1.p1  ORF type:complete len:574 (-),score=70.06 TRINITY_DN27012_c0_g1_i1:393-2114(-)
MEATEMQPQTRSSPLSVLGKDFFPTRPPRECSFSARSPSSTANTASSSTTTANTVSPSTPANIATAQVSTTANVSDSTRIATPATANPNTLLLTQEGHVDSASPCATHAKVSNRVTHEAVRKNHIKRSVLTGFRTPILVNDHFSSNLPQPLEAAGLNPSCQSTLNPTIQRDESTKFSSHRHVDNTRTKLDECEIESEVITSVPIIFTDKNDWSGAQKRVNTSNSNAQFGGFLFDGTRTSPLNIMTAAQKSLVSGFNKSGQFLPAHCNNASQNVEKRRKFSFLASPNEFTTGLKAYGGENPTCLPKKQRVIPPKGRPEAFEFLKSNEDIHDTNKLEKAKGLPPCPVSFQSTNLNESVHSLGTSSSLISESSTLKPETYPKQGNMRLRRTSKSRFSKEQFQTSESKDVASPEYSPPPGPVSSFTSRSPSVVQQGMPLECSFQDKLASEKPTARELEWGRFLALSCASSPNSHVETVKKQACFSEEKQPADVKEHLTHSDDSQKLLNALRSVNGGVRSEYAVQLEKRAIRLALEECVELRRLKNLNILPKYSSNTENESCMTSEWSSDPLDPPKAA